MWEDGKEGPPPQEEEEDALLVEEEKEEGETNEEEVLCFSAPSSRFPRYPLPEKGGASVLETVVPAREYDRGLGMRRAGEVESQIKLDAPRCVLTVDGRRDETGEAALKKGSRVARLCTQAALAPPVEWMLFGAGLLMRERSPSSHTVVCVEGRSVLVLKRLVATPFSSPLSSPLPVLVAVHGDASLVCVSIEAE